MTELVINPKDQRAMAEFQAKLMAALRAKPIRYKVTIVEYREKKTDAMRRFYHVACVNLFVEFEREQGNVVSHESAHEMAKAMFRKKVPIVNLHTGEVVGERPQAGGEMSNAEWHEYIELYIAWLADAVGLIVQDSRDWYEAPKQEQTT